MDLKKYWIIMPDKTMRFAAILLAFILTRTIAPVNAGELNLPLTQYGPGVMYENQFTPHAARGNLNLNTREPFAFTPANPASYGALEWTSFQTGVRSDLTEISKGDQSLANENSTLGFIVLGFPVMQDNNWGMAAGLMPFSHSSYRVNQNFDNENQRLRFEGAGRLNKVFIGSSYGIVENLTIGANVGYLFGQYNRNNGVEFVDEIHIENQRTSWQSNLSGFIYEGAMQYRYETDNNRYYQAGAAVEFPAQISGDMQRFVHTYFSSGSGKDREIEIVDTIEFRNDLKKTISIPPRFSIGFETGSNNHWTAGFQAHYRQWSNFEGLVSPTPLTDEIGISAGGSYLPDHRNFDNYFRAIKYNFGMNYVLTNIEVDGNQLAKWSISAGFDFPVPRNRTKIHIAARAGQYTNNESIGFDQRFLEFSAGLTLTEKWFHDRRIE